MSSAGGVGVLLNDGFVKLGYDCFARVGHVLKVGRHRDSSTWILVFISQPSVSSLRLTRSLFAASSHVLETPGFVQLSRPFREYAE